MLGLRGFCGCVPCAYTRGFYHIISSLFRFLGLFGIYYSLQYLTLANATVLTFLAPILTTFTGAYFLGETFYWRQVIAGCMGPSRATDVPLES